MVVKRFQSIGLDFVHNHFFLRDIWRALALQKSSFSITKIWRLFLCGLCYQNLSVAFLIAICTDRSHGSQMQNSRPKSDKEYCYLGSWNVSLMVLMESFGKVRETMSSLVRALGPYGLQKTTQLSYLSYQNRRHIFLSLNHQDLKAYNIRDCVARLINWYHSHTTPFLAEQSL